MISRIENHPCTYLPNLAAKTHYRYLESCDAKTYEAMLERGWRRFGKILFRPECSVCQQCRSLRVEVERFTPNRSMSRAGKKNADLDVEWSKPLLTVDHLELFRRYHQAQNVLRGWPLCSAEPDEYCRSFVEGSGVFGHELRLELGGRLIAVALVDVLPRAISAVYCYYDPNFRDRTLGVMAILQQIQKARELGIPYVYLGYWVEPNSSMRYKSRYRPHQLLQGRPADLAEPNWRSVTDRSPTFEAPHE